MTHMEDYDLGVCRIDRVKDEVWVANGGEHADAGFVGKMTDLGKILEQAGDRFDALDHSDRSRAITLVNIVKYVVYVRK